MNVRYETVTLTCDASGACTARTIQKYTGAVLGVLYTRGTLDNSTTDITVTTNETAQTILTLTNVTTSKNYYPRSINQGATGTDLTGVEPINAANEQIKIVVAQGGNLGAGSIILVIG